MAYTLKFGPTDTKSELILQDGTVDSNTTSLSLVGKNYPGYGQLLNENFIDLLENFSNATSPSAALPGQIWWDSRLQLLSVNAATAAGSTAAWKTLGSMYTADPVTDVSAGIVGSPKGIQYVPQLGDLWWDSANSQLKLQTKKTDLGPDGWYVIGPASNSQTGQTGATPDTVTDTVNLKHTVVKFYVGGGNPVAIISKDSEFTPSPAIAGFASIKPGFNLSSSFVQTYHGTADSALSLLIDGVAIDASKFARSDVATVSTAQLNTTSNTGLAIGGLGNIVLDIDSSTGAGRLRHTISNENIEFITSQNGTPVTVMQINGTLAQAEVPNMPTTNNGVANKFYVDTKALLRDGTNTVTGNIIPSSNNSINLGSTTNWFSSIFGTSVQAKYADLAERFAADAEYEAGTVVELGGTHEITIATTALSDSVFGVISTNAAYLMNASSGTNSTHPPVAIGGRVPVKVVGKICKGQRLVSAGNGHARAATKDEMTPWNVIGRALQDKLTDGLGVIEAIVKINN